MLGGFNMNVKRKFEMDFGALVKVAAFVLIVAVIIFSLKLLMDYNEKMREKAQKEEMIARLEIIKAELEYDVNSKFDRDYVIRIARRELGLVLPNEITYFFDYGEDRGEDGN